ncbi:arabinan endo-1,5-alpha-L-arabinosidase [Actinomyces sp. 594]|uniref:arabinan endo-1,5-alpha-L-arabinosidase n=1 Tax=Actinomyces sp. 594 TaxID=2057793 RepID=UPI001C59E9AF|nr:arabinan endo-1,5-alpha-L-arabinosidase [Actinomyces sp. 594]MBW3069979.1 arabinan endo-1,5-alpha-L-arabinosidase [Actinomyces sp. 594]
MDSNAQARPVPSPAPTATPVTAYAPGTGADPGAWGAHDPTVIRSRDGRYYMFSTDTEVAGSPGVGVQVRRSDNLLHWQWVGHAFDGVPASAEQWSGAQGIWAPDVVERDGEYRMYYSASTFGSRRSCINLAVSASLEGPWTDLGPVVRTRAEDPVNAIDAAIVRTAEGTDLMLYGSFFGGLRLIALDERGLPRRPGDLGVPVSRRTTAHNGPIEGSHMWYDAETGRYLLICSFDSLFDTYNIRAARSEHPEGPFLDAAGRRLGSQEGDIVDGGTKILGSLVTTSGETELAPGHSNHLVTPDGMLLVHHVRTGADPERHRAQLRRMALTSAGWPVVSPVEYDALPLLPLDGAALDGPWRVWRMDTGSTRPATPSAHAVHLGALLPTPAEQGGARATLDVDGRAVDAVVWRTQASTAFAGLERDEVVLGVRAE